MTDLLGTLEIRIRGTLDDLDRDLDRAKSKATSAVDDISTKGEKRIGGMFSSIGKTAAGVFAGLGALNLGKEVFSGAISEWEEAQKVARQTEAVLRSTGGAANVMASDVDKLASSLSKKAGIDDEVIASGENMLLTFTNVRNEVGAGNDIFNQATNVGLDMAVALGEDASTAAMRLGKALNDPIGGVTALRRVGVQLTDQQEDQIKAMVAAGDIMGAQKIILAELTKEFGGSAEAQATFLGKAQVAWGNFLENVGAGASKVLNIIMWGFGHPDATIGPGVARWEALFLRIGAGIRQVVDWVVANWPQIQATIVTTLDQVTAAVSAFVDLVTTIWDNFGSQIMAVAEAVWGQIRNNIETILHVIHGLIVVITGLIHGDWSQVWDGIKEIVEAAWNYVRSVITTAINIIRNVISAGLEVVVAVFQGAWDAIGNAAGSAADWLLDLLGSLPGRMLDALGDLSGLLWDAGVALIKGLIGGILSMFGRVASTLGDLASRMVSWKGPPAKDRKLLYGAGQLIIGGLVGGIRDSYGDVRGALGGITAMVGGEGSVSLTAGEAASGGGSVVVYLDGDLSGLVRRVRGELDRKGIANGNIGLRTR